jgi:TIR domain-containing protein
MADRMGANMPTRNQIFVSYSHKDRRLFEEFETMLAPAIQNGRVDLWDDRKIPPGAKWKEEIQKALASASVAVLLVSQNFLASRFIVDRELPPLFKAAREEGVTIFCIYLSSCLFEQTEIASYQAAHDVSRPLDRLPKSQRQAVLREVCAKLIRAAPLLKLHCVTDVLSADDDKTAAEQAYPEARSTERQTKTGGHARTQWPADSFPRVLPLGDWLEEFKKTGLFTFFHLQQTDSIKDGAQHSTVIFKPTARQFRALVTMKVSVDEEDDILGMELVIAKSFMNSQDSPFARDIAASFLRLAIPQQDLASILPLVKAVRSNEDPDPFQSAYKTFSGTQRVYRQELAESKLRFENLNVGEIDSLTISVTLRRR